MKTLWFSDQISKGMFFFYLFSIFWHSKRSLDNVNTLQKYFTTAAQYSTVQWMVWCILMHTRLPNFFTAPPRSDVKW